MCKEFNFDENNLISCSGILQIHFLTSRNGLKFLNNFENHYYHTEIHDKGDR